MSCEKGKPLPVWLHDESAEVPMSTAGSQRALSSPRQPHDGVNAQSSDVRKHVLSKSQEQSFRRDEMNSTLSERGTYRTHFDVLTMMNVSVNAACEEITRHARSTVEYTDLVATVSLSFTSGEISVFLDETDGDLEFAGIKLPAEYISGCHLLVDSQGSAVVINVDTNMITDVTQLLLRAERDEATRELYSALVSLCQRRAPRACSGPGCARLYSPSSSCNSLRPSRAEALKVGQPTSRPPTMRERRSC